MSFKDNEWNWLVYRKLEIISSKEVKDGFVEAGNLIDQEYDDTHLTMSCDGGLERFNFNNDLFGPLFLETTKKHGLSDDAQIEVLCDGVRVDHFVSANPVRKEITAYPYKGKFPVCGEGDSGLIINRHYPESLTIKLGGHVIMEW